VKLASTFANCSGLNTVLPTTSNRLTVIVWSPAGRFLEVWESAFGAGVGLLVGAVTVRVREVVRVRGGWTSCGGGISGRVGELPFGSCTESTACALRGLVVRLLSNNHQPQPGLAEALRTFRSHDTQLASARNYEV